MHGSSSRFSPSFPLSIVLGLLLIGIGGRAVYHQFQTKSGNTYSRTLGTTIGSESLTTVFGMETGVAFQIWSPERSLGRQ